MLSAVTGTAPWLLAREPINASVRAAHGCQDDRPMAEGHKFENPPSGVCLSEEEVLGETFLGARLSGSQCGERNREMIKKYIEEQEGKPVNNDSRYVIDNPIKPPPSRR